MVSMVRMRVRVMEYGGGETVRVMSIVRMWVGVREYGGAETGWEW
jgi:hypothetical protein